MSSNQKHSQKHRGRERKRGATMDGCEAESKIPRLPLFKPPPMHSPERPGMLTPPLHTSASVPFGWEEEPGKPRPCTDIVSFSNPMPKLTPKCLELPPRLQVDAINISKIPSPTTVLEGPYMGSRRVSDDFCGSFGAERGRLGTLVLKEKSWFGSWSENAFKVKHVFSSSADNDTDHVVGSDNNVRTRKMKPYGSFSNPFHAKSHVWERICERWKQVVPWRSGKLKKYGCGWL
uniref:Uncharacterized protein n=1 Tax=Lotus japonicus TaxID=34305 RepID=I3SEZ5_LOTJA|nr:unknown [Lotus japonicus]